MRIKTLFLALAISLAAALKGAPTPGFLVSKDRPVPDEYWVFAPPVIGQFTPASDNEHRSFSFDPNVYDSKTKVAKEAVRFIYHYSVTNNMKNPQTRRTTVLDVIKYGSEAAAQLEVKKRIDAAVPTDQYDKKVKFPRCDPKHESDFKGPEQFVKKIPLAKGGDAYVLRDGKFWDYQCKKASNRNEYVTWSSGVYVFRIDCSPALTEKDDQAVYGQGELLFAEYQKARGE